MNIGKFYQSKRLLKEFLNGHQTVDEKFLEALDIVAMNEKRLEIQKAITKAINTLNAVEQKELLFHLLYLQFHQTWVYRHLRNKTKTILEKISKVSDELSKSEYKTVVKYLKFLFKIQNYKFFQSKDHNRELLLNELEEAYRYISKDAPRYYYTIAYSYAYFYLYLDKRGPEKALDILNDCLHYYISHGYYSKATFSTIRLILSIYLTFHRSDLEEKIKELVINNSNVVNNLLTLDRIALHQFVGVLYIKLNKVKDGQKYLEQAYEHIKEISSQHPYHFIEVISWLSRSYLYIGNLERAYRTIEEFYNFINRPEIKKMLNISIYRLYYSIITASILFIFSEIEVDIDRLNSPEILEIVDKGRELTEKLIKQLKNGDNSIFINKSANIFLLSSMFDSLKNRLIASGRQSSFLKKIKELKKLIPTHLREGKFFAEIIQARNLLALGHIEEFKLIVERKIATKKTPHIKHILIWKEALMAIYHYLEDDNLKKLTEKFEKLRQECVKLRLIREASELEFYKRIIQSSHIIKDNKEKFQQTLYIDLYIAESIKKGKELIAS